MRHDYAQTLPQLLAQLQSLGHSHADLEQIRRVSSFADRLFAGLARGSGKPFTAHLIGVASILARQRHSAATLSAALLHAAYAEGDWSEVLQGDTRDRRQILRDVLGDEAEDLVFGYSRLRWRQPGAIPEHTSSRRHVDSRERKLLVMRLANELEEYLDNGSARAPDAQARRQFRRIYGPYMLELARLTAVPGLGLELESAFEADEAIAREVSSAHAESHVRIAEGKITAFGQGDGQSRPAESLSLVEWVSRHASERPDAVAICGSAQHHTSWAELLERAGNLARTLAKMGAAARPVAALLRQSSVPMALLATRLAGRSFAPIARDYPQARRQRILDVLEPGCIVVDDETKSLVADVACPILNVDQIASTALGQSASAAAAPIADLESPALVIFTSGSTGEPLGVVHNEWNLLQIALRSNRALQIDKGDRLSMLSPGMHIAGMTDLFRSFVSGATLVPIDIAEVGVDAASAAIRDAGVTVLHATPSLAVTMFETVADVGFFKSVRRVHLGGELLSGSWLACCRSFLPPDTVIVNQLGCSEMSGFCQAFFPARAVLPDGVVPAGYPVEGVNVRVVDEQGHPVALGETGRIVVSGAGLALGYWKAPALTASVFRAATLSEPRSFLTGDRGRWLADGQLEHCGRVDHRVQIRGQRVELAEIEVALQRLATVVDAVVVATNRGNQTELVAHVVPAENFFDTEILRKQLADLLPLSMLPARYEWHTRLPRMPSGKVDRLALAQVPLEVKGSPTDEKRGDSLASLKKSAAPDLSSVRANAIENTVIAIWREVLGDVQIRADSGFFEIGGDSLQAMRVCSRLSAVTGIEIGLRAFFETPKLGQLVEKLTSAGNHGRSVG